MNHSGEMTPQSPLNKPLSELTEDDISQLTREDCRRFLKEKGMRRPSWNKSQAIQQVISLKALLEVRSDPAGAEIDHKPPPPPPHPLPPPLPVAVNSTRAETTCADPQATAAPSPYRRRDRLLPVVSPAGDAGREPMPLEIGCAPSLSGGSGPSRDVAHAPPGQLTIFYGGRVNVYDGVAANKARAILQLAASPGFEDLPVEMLQSTRPPLLRFAPGCSRPFVGPTTTSTAEGPTTREVSLQRYLVKRKDRFKGKKIVGASSPSYREIMFNQRPSTQTTNEESNRGDLSSPTQPMPPSTPTRCGSMENKASPTQPMPPSTPTRCGSMENKASKLCISVDLNEEGDGN